MCKYMPFELVDGKDLVSVDEILARYIWNLVKMVMI